MGFVRILNTDQISLVECVFGGYADCAAGQCVWFWLGGGWGRLANLTYGSADDEPDTEHEDADAGEFLQG
jgi:hypothetical protein